MWRIIGKIELNQMLSLQKKYYNEKTIGNEKERLKSQIDNVDYEIDSEVYKLYGITDEEKKIIEESLKWILITKYLNTEKSVILLKNQ